MDNPERILEILNDKLWVEGEEHQIIGKIEAAKEIHDHYMRFAKWVYMNVNFIFDELSDDMNKVYEYWSNLPEGEK